MLVGSLFNYDLDSPTKRKLALDPNLREALERIGGHGMEC